MRTPKELSFRAIFLGFLISLVLVGANGYLSLKAGLTIAASIPSAVAAIIVLRFFKNHTIYEANIIQAIASSGEAVIAAAVFTMPALIILKFWRYFHFWETFLLTLFGGLIGVFLSIPFRKILLKEEELKFPEGIATAEILKLTDYQSKKQKKKMDSISTEFRFLLISGCFSVCIKLAQSGLKIVSEMIEGWFVKGHAVIGFGFSLSPALLGVGYIIGLPATLAIFMGTALTWLFGLPSYSYLHHMVILHSYRQTAFNIWEHELRYVGVGVMLVATLHTLTRLAKPIYQALQFSVQKFFSQRVTQEIIKQDNRDISSNYILLGIFSVCLGFFIFLFRNFFHIHLPFESHYLWIIILALIFVIIFSVIFVVVSAYLAGLIGTSNLPISGLTILSMLLSSLMLVLFCGLNIHRPSDIVVASSFIIILNAMLTTVMSTAGLHVQCLKTSSMIKATPYKQELAFLIGILPGALLIVPIMQLMFSAYGMAGIFPHPGMDPSEMLSVPQATLIAETAIGFLSHKIPWLMVSIGVCAGILGIVLNSLLIHFKKGAFPPIAFGLGMFLPAGISGPLVVGGFVCHLVNQWFRKEKLFLEKQHIQKVINTDQFKKALLKLNKHQAKTKRRGLLIGCGYIAGESISGILLTIPFVIAGNDRIFNIMPQHLKLLAQIAGIMTFLGLVYWLYKSSKLRSNLFH